MWVHGAWMDLRYWKPQRFDAITLEVLWTRLISVVDEAAKAIVRTSFSTLSNEANDFA